MNPSTNNHFKLGKTDVEISPLGIGTWAWGDRWVWGFGSDYAEEDLKEAYDISRAEGVTFFDTAEAYGLGKSERLLGEFMQRTGSRPVIATKFLPLPWRLRKAALKRALKGSLKRLGLDQVDLYQIHFPVPVVAIETWMDVMAEAVETERIRAVGVSNYDAKQMGRAHNALAERGVPLASNQVHYSLLHRKPEFNGVMQLCRDLDISLIAYSPLEMGILTGKYTPDNPLPGYRGLQYSSGYLEAVQPLIDRLREIGDAHNGKSPAQVAINWVICKGAIPIPGAKTPRHARSNAEAMGFRLTDDEVADLDALSERVAK